MKISNTVKLAPYTTFKIGGEAKFFCMVKDQFDALNAYEFAKDNHQEVFILGGGSNVLISDEGFNGLVVKVENKGIEILHEDESTVTLKIASGEVWDAVVSFAVKNNWWGIENLSHIPGSTGAIAVQNVGAYGQEASNVIKSVTVFDKETHQILELNNKQCGFTYRKSIFNSTQKGKYIIFYITLELSKKALPILSYRDVKAYFNSSRTLSVPPFDAKDGTSPLEGEKNMVVSLAEIRQAIISIRDKKYPFPTQARLGNAGSFFKNPVLDNMALGFLKTRVASEFGIEAAESLSEKIFNDGDKIKVPAAFLLEICGLKDVQEGGAKINRNQPLVIVNETGTATASDVLNLAKKVIKTVYKRTGISLQIEPELIGFTQDELSGIILKSNNN